MALGSHASRPSLVQFADAKRHLSTAVGFQASVAE